MSACLQLTRETQNPEHVLPLRWLPGRSFLAEATSKTQRCQSVPLVLAYGRPLLPAPPGLPGRRLPASPTFCRAGSIGTNKCTREWKLRHPRTQKIPKTKSAAMQRCGGVSAWETWSNCIAVTMGSRMCSRLAGFLTLHLGQVAGETATG